VANAIDIAPAGSTVMVELRRTAEWIEVHVIDEGPGMSAERRATAFTRFWKAPDTEKRVGGFGIGLAIVKQLVTVDGGEVELLEAPSGGVDAVVRVRPAVRAKGGRGDTPPPASHAPRRRRAAASAATPPGDSAD
jgi:signal transduction histidine kinase